MHDICVIGSGIIGKYLAHHLAKQDVLWISGQNASYHSAGEYKLENYLGEVDTWQEKATGLFSFPTILHKDLFPFSWQTYKDYEKDLKAELGIKSLATLTRQSPYSEFVSTLESIFPGEQTQYFSSAHSELVGPYFSTRDEYDNYWHFKKAIWDFSADKSDYLQAEYFILKNGQATELICRDKNGQRRSISAKRYILACHTPGTIALLLRTFAFNRIRHQKLLGRYFSDHAQTSLGVLIPSALVPRTTISSFCYQDRSYNKLPYRLEFHIAPPRPELVKRTRMRMPQFSAVDFEQCFLRIVIVYEFPKLASSRLQFQGKETDKVTLNAVLLSTLRQQRKKLLPYILERFFQDKRMVLLNQHFPFFFAGHLAGGVCYPEMVNENLQLQVAENVTVAGLATLPSTGLFNPTFAALIMAKHILNTL